VSDEFGFFLLLLCNGVLIGLMYSLIALGFVLVYKATDAINFAQGEFIFFAGLVVAAGATIYGAPAWVAALAGLVGMIGFGFGLERVVLRPLIGRPVVAIIMATIGLAAVLRGLGPLLWGAETKNVPLPVPVKDEPIVWGPLFIPPIQLLGALVSLLFLGAFGWFFLKSRKGVAMRAVADSQQVAMAMGIDVERYFALAWAMAGIVSALGGMVWGNMLGVDIQLALVGLKVFPVVILGGLDSIPGAIVGGLIVGIVENVAAGYVDPYVGGGTKDFAPYLLMILTLMVRPYGIFGKPIIERI
jgi:branched-chain amino acid transport system permease protein